MVAFRRTLLAVAAVGVVVAGLSAAATQVDLDGDGLAFDDEGRAGTDPLAADTDGDGLDDAREVGGETDPTAADTDDDALDDGRERELGTDPTDPDTDDDGLADGRERELGADPTRGDTDGDGIADGREVEAGTDPTAADTDGDGLADPRERELGTDPTAADTDDDAVQDPRERELGTSPTNGDADGDGLDDGRERELGTDPTDPDTDRDGLPDGAEVTREGVLPDADPLRRDVFVEVDYMAGERPSEQALAAVRRQFARAPVPNPDGSTGVALHVVVDEELPRRAETYSARRPGSDDDAHDYYGEQFDRCGEGWHYGVAVVDAKLGSRDVAGAAQLVPNSFVFEQFDGNPNRTGHVFMHELGHSLGLVTFDGVDSRKYAYEEYPSVMNYNAPGDAYGYSDGTAGPADRNDWAVVAGRMSLVHTFNLGRSTELPCQFL